jgi:Zn-finger nucleic acid-binding protein
MPGKSTHVLFDNRACVTTKTGDLKMNCPVCNNVLVTVEQDGFSLEMCPVCKGGWLDRKDLARLLGQGSGVVTQASIPTRTPPPPQQQVQPEQRGGIGGFLDAFSGHRDSHHGYDKHHEHESHDHDHSGYDKHKKRSAASRLFDLFD